MKVLKVFMIAITLTGCAHTFSGDELGTELEDIPEFESLVGSGILETTDSGISVEQSKAWLSFDDNYTVVGKDSCNALILTSTERSILAVAKCDEDNNYYICGRAPAKCFTNYKTKKSNSTLSLTKDLGFGEDDIRLVVDFYVNKIVYRIQGQTCLIGYPHGCIISGFNWVDEDIYTFIKQ